MFVVCLSPEYQAVRIALRSGQLVTDYLISVQYCKCPCSSPSVSKVPAHYKVWLLCMKHPYGLDRYVLYGYFTWHPDIKT